MPLYDVVVESFLGSDTRIMVVKNGNPKKDSSLDRNSKYETIRSEPLTAKAARLGSPRKREFVRCPRLSTNAKKNLQRIGGVVSAGTSAHQSIFLTGTFPGDSFRAQRAIASQSAWLVHRLKSWLYKQVGANVGYYVWEFQRRGTLHLHYVVLVPDAERRKAIIEGFRDEWIRLIQGASIRSGEDLFVGRKQRNFFLEKEKLQIYAQECYKSSASYLSKYLSKKKTSKFPPPSRLWGSTRAAKNLVASSLIQFRICHKKLADAEDIAFRLEAESDTPREATRFWRHRFSQGFTILIYNDTFRIHLSRIGKTLMPSPKTSYLEKAQILKREMEKAGLMAYCFERATRVGWGDFLSVVSPELEYAPPMIPQDACMALLEVRALVGEAPISRARTRYDIRNRISAILTEIIEDHDLSILRIRESDPSPGVSPAPVAQEVEVVQDSGKQLSVQWAGTGRPCL